MATTAAAGCIAATSGGVLASSGGDDPFSTMTAMSRSELGSLRGGVKLGIIDADVGIEVTTNFNGEYQVTTSFYPKKDGTVQNLGTTISAFVDDTLAKAKAGEDVDVDVGVAVNPVAAVTTTAEAVVETVAPGTFPDDGTGALDQVTQTTGDVPVVNNLAAPIEVASTPAVLDSAASVQVAEGPALDTSQVTPATTDSVTTNHVDIQTTPEPAATAQAPLHDTVQPLLTQVQTISTDTGAEVLFVQPDNGGFTRVVHETLSGHLSLIENTADGISISQLVSLNFHFLNFQLVESMAQARIISDSLRSTFIQGTLH